MPILCNAYSQRMKGGGDVDNRCKRAEVAVVIKTTTLIGTGTENDPAREVVQYWTLDGKLLATNDPISHSN